MLTLTIGATDGFDEVSNTFGQYGGIETTFEHSLVSLSKWESKVEKPFLGPDLKTTEETMLYVEMMLLDPKMAPEVLRRINEKDIEAINNYIEAKMTATWFSERARGPRGSEIITAELIYYWMINFSIPFECQYWHLNRLLTLIRVCSAKSQKPKRMSPAEMMERQRAMNEQRKAKYGTTG